MEAFNKEFTLVSEHLGRAVFSLVLTVQCLVFVVGVLTVAASVVRSVLLVLTGVDATITRHVWDVVFVTVDTQPASQTVPAAMEEHRGPTTSPPLRLSQRQWKNIEVSDSPSVNGRTSRTNNQPATQTVPAAMEKHRGLRLSQQQWKNIEDQQPACLSDCPSGNGRTSRTNNQPATQTVPATMEKHRGPTTSPPLKLSQRQWKNIEDQQDNIPTIICRPFCPQATSCHSRHFDCLVKLKSRCRIFLLFIFSFIHISLFTHCFIYLHLKANV